MTDDIVQRSRDRVLELVLSRPSKKNALTADMYRTLARALADAEADPAIDVVLFAGEGDAFCAGNDINDFLRPGGAEAAVAFIRAIAGFGKPVVAAVQGLAIGVGMTMLLHCDLVYVAPGTRFVTPFASIGIVPEAGSSLLLPARIGMAKASAMMLLGEPLQADAPEAGGLVTAVVDGDLLGHARARAAALVAMPPQALAATRRLLRAGQDQLAAAMDAEETAFAAALKGAEAKEAFAAFLEKRPPVFPKGAA